MLLDDTKRLADLELKMYKACSIPNGLSALQTTGGQSASRWRVSEQSCWAPVHGRYGKALQVQVLGCSLFVASQHSRTEIARDSLHSKLFTSQLPEGAFVLEECDIVCSTARSRPECLSMLICPAREHELCPHQSTYTLLWIIGRDFKTLGEMNLVKGWRDAVSRGAAAVGTASRCRLV